MEPQETVLSKSFTDAQSSQIREISYAPENSQMQITFKGGSQYRYFDVHQSVFDRALEAPSIGSFFASYIKHNHKFEKIETPADPIPLPEVTE